MGPGTSLRQVFSRLVNEKMDREVVDAAQRAAGSGEKEPKAARQRRWLQAVEEHYTVKKACKVAGILRNETDRWAKDPAFRDAFDEARWVFVEGVEGDLLALGNGANKGQVIALIAFLNAHHPEFGRIKSEQLARILGPIIKKFHAAVLQAAGEKVARQVTERLEEVCEARLTAFSD